LVKSFPVIIVLMQPQNPNPNYDFILKDKPQPKTSMLPNNPLVKVAGVIVAILLIVLVIGIVSSSKSGSSTGMLDTLGQAQEISRVTTAQAPNLKDPAIRATAATTQASVSSEAAQINKYLAAHRVKVDKKKLATYQSSDTDSKMSSALQASNLDTTYLTYLQTALNDYSQSIKTSFAATKNTEAKSILQNAFASTQTLLSAPPLKS
jgi:hypothetical protein